MSERNGEALPNQGARVQALEAWAKRALRFLDSDDVAGSELETEGGSSADIAQAGYELLGIEPGALSALSEVKGEKDTRGSDSESEPSSATSGNAKLEGER